MRLDRDYKVVRMIPLVKASGTAISSKTHGSGTQVSTGIADTSGYDRCRLEVEWRTLTAANHSLKTLRVYFASTATTLYASGVTANGGSLFSGRASGIVLSAKAASRGFHALDFSLAQMGTRKKYMGCKLIMSGATSGMQTVRAFLYRGDQFPPKSPVSQTNFNYTTFTQFDP